MEDKPWLYEQEEYDMLDHECMTEIYPEYDDCDPSYWDNPAERPIIFVSNR
jgi:hypothetical protein